MPVVTRSRVSLARGDGGAGALPSWGSASAAPAPAPRRVLREDVASQSRHHHHHGLKEKLRALTLDYEQQKQKQLLAASLGGGGPASRQLRRSIMCLNATEVVNDENADEEEVGEDGGRVAKRRYDAFALVPEAAVLRENAAPPQASNDNAVSSCPTKKAVRVPRLPLPPARKLSLGGAVGANAVSSPIQNQKAVRVLRLPVLPARKLSLGGAVGGGKLKAAGEVVSGTAEAAESRILVFVRLRPMSRKEKEAGSRNCVKIVNRKEVLLMEFASENDYLRLKRVRDSHFCFDSVFPDSTTQAEVYSTSSADLVEGVLQGRNGTVFCYGATGAGKTYTMLGTMENPGVMVLAINDLFSKVTQKHSIKLSYLEIYNETVRDLLSPGTVNLREDKQQGAVAAGLTQRSVYSTEEVMELLQKGNKNRTTEPTRVNETSSRSHAVLQVIVEYKSSDGVNIGKRIGKLSLIDLAGSERALATDQRTLRSIEGANINKSLLALSSCINALVEGKKHIPYRNSKLTLLLKDSLGGSCNTVMIANISPSNLSFGETQNTLHWADRAKEIKIKIQTTVNEENMDQTDSETMLVLDLQKKNSMLREQLAKQQQKLLIVEAQLLASKTSQQQSPAPSSHVSTPGSTQRKTRRSTLAGNYFNTLDSKRPTVDNVQVRELQRKVKTLESEIEKMKKEHLLQLKQKDEFIRGLINSKAPNNCEEAASDRRVVTRASLKKAQRDASASGELKSPSHRFTSPAPTAKKRTFWDIGGNSPSVLSANGRKTRSHVAPETPKKGSSKLLQPGFARQISSHRNI